MRLLLLLSFFLINPLFAQDDIVNRIRPYGTVAVEGGDDVAAAVEKPEVKVVRSAQEIYQQHCSLCHEAGVAGAPKFRNEADWAIRFNQGKTLNNFLMSVKQGLNAMPPMGTCQNCSDEEFKQAIEYMLPPKKS